MVWKTGVVALESLENADVKVRVYGDAAMVTGQSIGQDSVCTE